MAGYDEELLRNPFYQALEKTRPDLCRRVAQDHGVVLVPCSGSVEVSADTALRFDRYVLLPVGDGFQTADGTAVSIRDQRVVLGIEPAVSVSILFEETFYNEEEQSYSLLCLAGPLEVQQHRGQDPEQDPELDPGQDQSLFSLRTPEDARDLLGPQTLKLDKILAGFCQTFKEQETKGLQHHMDAVKTLYTKCLQCLMRDTRLKLLAKQEVQMLLIKQALEIYVHQALHDVLFKFVGSLEASQDAAFNKTTRSLQDLQQSDVGMKAELSTNLSRAKRKLNQLNSFTSPLLKLLCLRGVILTALHTPNHTVNMEAVDADQLLSVILFLLLKTDIPNWVSNLRYISSFSVCVCVKEELAYCLSSFQAAVEFISLGSLSPAVGGPGNQKVLLDLSSQSPVSQLYQHIARGEEDDVRRILHSDEDVRMCHPLCSCDLCDLQMPGRVRDPSVVTCLSRDEQGHTPLHVAALCGQVMLIDLLVSCGSEVNATELHGHTPLHLACRGGHQGVTLLLLHYKADTDAQDDCGNTPLHVACTYGHEDCVKALVYYDLEACRLDQVNGRGDSALHLATRWGYLGVVGVLLENGAPAHLRNKKGEAPLDCALNTKVLALLEAAHHQSGPRGRGSGRGSTQAAGRWPRTPDSSASVSSLTPDHRPDPDPDPVRHREVEKLLRAVADGDLEMVRYLLEWEEEEDDKGRGQTPPRPPLCHPLCQCSVCVPHTHKPPSLQATGVCVNSCNSDGFSPLHVASLHGHAPLASRLLRGGARLDACTALQATPLHLACQNQHTQVVRLLLEGGAKLNKKDHYGNTPLINTCMRGHLDTAQLLLEGGAWMNVRNCHGSSALHEAVRGGHLGLVELLLQGGASAHLENQQHRTPLDSALQLGGKNTEVVRALQKASGLSTDEEPIRMLSMPRGTLAHSFVQRLKQDGRRRQQEVQQEACRVEAVRRGSMGHSQDRGQLTRRDGPVVPSESRARERPLSRSLTLDPPAPQTEPPSAPPGGAPPLTHPSSSSSHSHSQGLHETSGSQNSAETSGTTSTAAGQPGTNPGTMPGTSPGTMPGTIPGTMPGTSPGTMPGTSPGTIPGTTPGTAVETSGTSPSPSAGPAGTRPQTDDPSVLQVLPLDK